MKSVLVAGETPFPPSSGARQRNLQLARRLAAELPVELAVLGPAGDARGEPFPVFGVPHARSRVRSVLGAASRPYSAVKLASPALGRLVRERRPAVAQAEELWLVPAARAASCALVLDAHNVETSLLRSFAAAEHRPLHRARWRWEARKTADWERRRAREVDAVCTTSDLDAEAFERFGAAEVLVVPNGVDVAAVAHRPPVPGARLLYVGNYGYRPNVVAARELIDDVLPRVRAAVAGATLRVVGRDPAPELLARARDAVEVAGAVPDVVTELHAARVLVVPLRSGSGTRLKVLEALAAGTPVVSTPLGVEGLAVQHGREALIGSTAAELAELAARVISDDALAAALSAAGRRLVESRYDWAHVARPLVELHQRLGAAASRSTR